MILNDLQLQITMKWRQRFVEALPNFTKADSHYEIPWVAHAQRQTIESQIAEFDQDIEDYKKRISHLIAPPPAPPSEASYDEIAYDHVVAAETFSGKLPGS